MKRKTCEVQLTHELSAPSILLGLPAVLTCTIFGFLDPHELARAECVSKAFLCLARRDHLWIAHCDLIWPCVSSSPLLSSFVTCGGAKSFFWRLHAVDVRPPTPHRDQSYGATFETPTIDVSTVVLLIKLVQDGRLAHCSARNLSPLMIPFQWEYSTKRVHLDFFQDSPIVIVEDLSDDTRYVDITVTAVRTIDGAVAAMVPVFSMDLYPRPVRVGLGIPWRWTDSCQCSDGQYRIWSHTEGTGGAQWPRELYWMRLHMIPHTSCHAAEFLHNLFTMPLIE